MPRRSANSTASGGAAYRLYLASAGWETFDTLLRPEDPDFQSGTRRSPPRASASCRTIPRSPAPPRVQCAR